MNSRNSWPGWETVHLIGRGSFGAVYEIQRRLLDETVEKAALKIISIPQLDSDIEELYNDGYDSESVTNTFQEHLKSIVAEYNLMRKLNGCTNVVNCDDIRYIQHEDGIGWDVFIKMELLTPMMKYLPMEIPETTVFQLAKDMCAALDACRKHGIVHRDIKPQNIFVSPDGVFKLGDFGIAKTIEKTMGGTKIGTYKYMAPEVYNNQPYGAAADIYSLGLVLYWMLNERRMPFLPLPPEKLRAGMEEEARQRRLTGEMLPPPKNGSQALKAIVLKACEYDPRKRFQSAAEMLEAIKKADGTFYQEQMRREEEKRRRAIAEQAGSRPDEVRKADEHSYAAGAVAVQPIPQPPVQQTPASKGNKTKLIIGIAAAAVVLVGVIVFAILAPTLFSKPDAQEPSVGLESEIPAETEPTAEPTAEPTPTPTAEPTATPAPVDAIQILEQPQDVSVLYGENAEVTVKAEGEGLTYAWYIKDFGDLDWTLSSLTGEMYEAAMTYVRNGRNAYCVITDAEGNQVTTETAVLSMKDAPVLKIAYNETASSEAAEVMVEYTTGTVSVPTWKGANESTVTVRITDGMTIDEGQDVSAYFEMRWSNGIFYIYPVSADVLGNYNLRLQHNNGTYVDCWLALEAGE